MAVLERHAEGARVAGEARQSFLSFTAIQATVMKIGDASD